MPRSLLFYLVWVAIGLSACRQERPTQSFVPAPKQLSSLVSDTAMVVSAHPLASEIGVQVLQQGGQAVDAAIAVQFALAVVFPEAGNLGGGGFAVLRQQDGLTAALDFRETAPAAAGRDMYLDEAGKVIPDLSWLGHLAAGVPGSVAGLEALHDSLGISSWHSLLQPAIDLAAEGFPISAKEAEHLNEKLPLIRAHNTRPSVFSVSDKWQAGDTLRQPDLAQTLMAIRDHGSAGFYQGWVADSLVAEMQRGEGLITHADLNAYQPRWREPVTGAYRDLQVISMPPPSSGGIALLQLLELVEDVTWQPQDWHQPAAVHRMVEAERRVYADRASFLGDPDYVAVPISGLLDSQYLAQRMGDYQPHLASASEVIAAGEPAPESEETTHTSIVDGQGNAISLTTTLNGWYGCCVVVGGAGFFLNNEMDDFSAKPGVPNFFGLVGAEANAIAAGKRMLSSMTPTIVLRDSSLWMVVGTPGGSTIITSVFQQIMNVREFGFNMQASVEAARFHHQWLPDTIYYEKGAFSPAVRDSLSAMGHALKPRRGPIGRVDAILIRPDGRLEAGADPRGDDAARGY